MRTPALLRNAGYNVAGALLPMVFALISMPLLLDGLGLEGLGVFSLVLALFAFAGLFDVGLGKALSRELATSLAEEKPRNFSNGLIWQTMLVVLAVSAVWAVLVFCGIDWWVETVYPNSGHMRTEIQGISFLVGLMIPVIALSNTLLSVLEGLHRFVLVNAIRTPVSCIAYLAPAVAVQLDGSIGAAICALAAVRVIGLILGFLVVLNDYKFCLTVRPLSGNGIGSILKYGGWLSVSGILVPMLVTGDRYYLVAKIDPRLIASYTVPLDMLYRAVLAPAAAMAVALPALASAAASSKGLRQIFSTSAWGCALLWILPLTLMNPFIPSILELWMGAEFAASSADIARVILIGVMVNGVASVPHAAILAVGRSDLPAKFHLIELPIYMLLLWWSVGSMGLMGAAAVWAIRMKLDAIALFYTCVRISPVLSTPSVFLSIAAMAGVAFSFFTLVSY